MSTSQRVVVVFGLGVACLQAKTCVLPYLSVFEKKHWYLNVLMSRFTYFGFILLTYLDPGRSDSKVKVSVKVHGHRMNKKASIRRQDSARRQFQAGLRGDVGL